MQFTGRQMYIALMLNITILIINEQIIKFTILSLQIKSRGKKIPGGRCVVKKQILCFGNCFLLQSCFFLLLFFQL